MRWMTYIKVNPNVVVFLFLWNHLLPDKHHRYLQDGLIIMENVIVYNRCFFDRSNAKLTAATAPDVAAQTLPTTSKRPHRRHRHPRRREILASKCGATPSWRWPTWRSAIRASRASSVRFLASSRSWSASSSPRSRRCGRRRPTCSEILRGRRKRTANRLDF